jgi:hypothetical protein
MPIYRWWNENDHSSSKSFKMARQRPLRLRSSSKETKGSIVMCQSIVYLNHTISNYPFIHTSAWPRRIVDWTPLSQVLISQTRTNLPCQARIQGALRSGQTVNEISKLRRPLRLIWKKSSKLTVMWSAQRPLFPQVLIRPCLPPIFLPNQFVQLSWFHPRTRQITNNKLKQGKEEKVAS